MSKRKSRKNSQSGGNSSKKTWGAAAGAVGVLALAFAGYKAMNRRKVSSGPPASATGSLVENRPVLSHKMFTGKAATVYKIAAEIPKVVDSQFCYCYCKRDHGHKTLLTCFTNTHGSKCEICMNEVLYAYELYQDKLSINDIVAELDRKFYRPYRGHRL